MGKYKRKRPCWGVLRSFAPALLLLLGLIQAPGVVMANGSEAVSVSGWFAIIWGDSEDGKSSMIYVLTDDGGNRMPLKMDPDLAKKLGGLLKFNGKYVNIQGVIKPAADTGGGLPSVKSLGPEETERTTMEVFNISLAKPPQSQVSPALEIKALAVSGSHPWVTIMCKFSDITDEPDDVQYFQGMYDDNYPGLNHYWMELSFGTANITGSTVGGTGWYDLPNAEIHYNPTDTGKGTNLDLLARECIDAVDADVDFSLYSGINMVFNSDFDNGWAWGGGWNDTLDGVTKTWSITWEPPWSYHDISVISHEMGHGFGLPHSSFDRAAVYDNPWDVMSKDRYNCAAAIDATYGCTAQHTISYHKDLLDWIPAARKISVPSGSSQTITLENLAVPATENYQMATIPIGGSATNFYTVEARQFTGYDGKLPDEGIVIHNVDTAEDIPAVLVPDGDPTNPWNVGEVFTDTTNNITVLVSGDTGTGFVVTISNGNLPPVSDANGPYSKECTGISTAVMLNGTGSSDPNGDQLSYSWSTTCNGSFDDPTLAQPTLTVNTSEALCDASCTVELTVSDADFSDSDTTTLSITDTIAPNLSGVPANTSAECDDVPSPATVTAADTCDQTVAPIFSETKTDGSCPNSYTLARNWDAADSCGNTSSATQVIEVVDTTPPIIDFGAQAAITPSDAPISFTATAIDNCDETAPEVSITGYECYFTTAKGKHVDKANSCIVRIEGDTITILDSGGVGSRISWTGMASDSCGNTTESSFETIVVNPAK